MPNSKYAACVVARLCTCTHLAQVSNNSATLTLDSSSSLDDGITKPMGKLTRRASDRLRNVRQQDENVCEDDRGNFSYVP